MNSEVIHEDDDLLRTGRRPQLVEPFDEAICIDRPLEYHEWFQAILFGDAGQHSEGRLVQFDLVNHWIFFLTAPFKLWHCFSRKHSLICIHQAKSIVPGSGQSPSQVGHQLSGHLRRLSPRSFEPLVLLLFDTV